MAPGADKATGLPKGPGVSRATAGVPINAGCGTIYASTHSSLGTQTPWSHDGDGRGWIQSARHAAWNIWLFARGTAAAWFWVVAYAGVHLEDHFAEGKVTDAKTNAIPMSGGDGNGETTGAHDGSGGTRPAVFFVLLVRTKIRKICCGFCSIIDFRFAIRPL